MLQDALLLCCGETGEKIPDSLLPPKPTAPIYPTFGSEQGSVAGVVAVGLAIVLQEERRALVPAPRWLLPPCSMGASQAPDLPLRAPQMSGSCYTSHIAGRAGASPSPEKSPSQLPCKEMG